MVTVNLASKLHASKAANFSVSSQMGISVGSSCPEPLSSVKLDLLPVSDGVVRTQIKPGKVGCKTNYLLGDSIQETNRYMKISDSQYTRQ